VKTASGRRYRREAIMRNTVLISVLLLSPLGAVQAAEDISKVNGAVHTEQGQRYGDLETVNGSISIAEGVEADSAGTVNGSISVADRAIVRELSTVNGRIQIADDVQVGGSAETVNGGIGVAAGSRVSGDLETVNGEIELDAAEVGGDLRTVGGNITVGADSTVRGGILVEKPRGSWFSWGEPKKPRIVIGRNAVVEGELVFKREVELYVHQSAQVGSIDGATAVRFSGDRP
jgi:cytoskeletal protein CcmA (bactofilin family)